MCELARDAPSTALQVSISKIIYCVRAFFLSVFFLLLLLLLFVFTVHLSEGLRLYHASLVCNGSFCTFHSGSYYMMIMDMLLLCWPQDDQASRYNDDRLFNSSYCRQWRSFLLTFSSPYSTTLATYTTYATGLSYLYHPSTLIFRKLKRPLLYTAHHIIISRKASY